MSALLGKCNLMQYIMEYGVRSKGKELPFNRRRSVLLQEEGKKMDAICRQ